MPLGKLDGTPCVSYYEVGLALGTKSICIHPGFLNPNFGVGHSCTSIFMYAASSVHRDATEQTRVTG